MHLHRLAGVPAILAGVALVLAGLPAPVPLVVPALATDAGLVRLIAPHGASAPVPGARVVRELIDGRVAIDVPAGRAADAYAELVRRHGPARVVADTLLSIAADHVPSDPLWTEMWGAQRIGMSAAWGVSLGSPTIVIAILDTGVTATADLADAVLPGTDIVNGDDDASDDEGHGTEVAQVAAGRIDNGIGGAGICPRCSILPVKVAGPDGKAWVSDADAGIVWAVDHGATVINMSFGSTRSEGVHDDAVAYARAAGVSVVAAAGNAGDTTAEYPANAAGVLSVAATGPTDAVETWSTHGEWVDLAAPGEASVLDLQGRAEIVGGTSYAAPVVAGALGLLAAVAPSSTMVDRERALTSTAVAISPSARSPGRRRRRSKGLRSSPSRLPRRA
jgi:subtilisin family serine protease